MSLFYEAVPSETFHFKGQRYTGCKHSNARIIGRAASNTLGEKIPILAVEKYVKPQWFKNVRYLPFQYRAQRKTRMHGILFQEWLRELDHKFESRHAIKQAMNLVVIRYVFVIRFIFFSWENFLCSKKPSLFLTEKKFFQNE